MIWSNSKIFFTTTHRDINIIQISVKQARISIDNGYKVIHSLQYYDLGDNVKHITDDISDLEIDVTKDEQNIDTTFTDLTNIIKTLQKKVDTLNKKGKES